MSSILSAPGRGFLVDSRVHELWQGVNHSPFLFRHNLADHELFQTPRLVRLAERVIEIGATDYRSPAAERASSKLDLVRRLVSGMANVDEGSHWFKVSAVNTVDAEYDEMLRAILAELESLVGAPIRKLATWAGMDIFINSPRLQVPYHFDHDSNFLMQIRGEKDVYLFDSTDRTILTESELEDFYRGNKLAGRYRPDFEGAGRCHHLSPGLGVHHPPLAPHLIRNGDDVSISVAVYFVLPGQEKVARVYQVNHFMRKLGLRPRPPGQSAMSDWAKNRLINAFAKSHPASYDERLYSGVQRLGAPTRLAKRVASVLRRVH